jgi:hypothetical protein
LKKNTQICSQLTLLTSEISGFLGQSPKPCPKREGFKGRETAGFGLRAVSLPLDEVVIIFIKKVKTKK